MKQFFILLLCISISFLSAAQNCDHGVTINKNYSRASAIQAAMDSFTKKDLPGLSIAVYTEAEGWWAGASGYSETETRTAMNTCNLQYLQSVAKTFMAVTILQLHEQKKIDLDAPITQYLPAKYAQYIKNAAQVTVKMLLNHTSGIAEYNSLPKYAAEVILNPLRIISMDKALALLKDEPAQYAPGEKYKYTNTNYLLLAMIGDALTGDHAAYMQKHIFQPLQMNNTYYHPGKISTHPALTSSYWDILSTGRPANITPMQKANVAPLKGDDGIISTPVDAVKFIKGLMEGKLLQDSSMKLMQQWVNHADGKPAYGLGLIYFDIAGIPAYGHGGGGLGAGCVLLYVPSHKLYLFLATNTGVVIDGLGGIKAGEMRDAVLMALLK